MFENSKFKVERSHVDNSLLVQWKVPAFDKSAHEVIAQLVENEIIKQISDNIVKDIFEQVAAKIDAKAVANIVLLEVAKQTKEKLAV